MSECQSIDLLVTPFVDGELSGVERERLERHARVCARCYSRIDAERRVRALLRGGQPLFRGECAPVALRVKCAAHCAGAAARGGTAVRWRRFVPLAAAAAVVLGVGSVFYQVSARSTRVMAAELTADHIKCFALDSPRTQESAAAIEADMAASFGWQVDLPERGGIEDLELIGSRLCTFGGGRAAHIMYRRHGDPVSVFMLPNASYDGGIVEALGHECAVWSSGGRTFVLVTAEGREDAEHLMARVQPVFH